MSHLELRMFFWYFHRDSADQFRATHGCIADLKYQEKKLAILVWLCSYGPLKMAKNDIVLTQIVVRTSRITSVKNVTLWL